MERYQLILAYDGTDFLGSQRQGHKRTIQGELEIALRNIGWRGRSILLAGRTDSGVHASGQVAAVDLDWKHTEGEFKDALNANLPEDISVWKVRKVNQSFHPRFDALARCYRYRAFVQTERNPLKERYAWRIEEKPSFELLASAASQLVGTHDFRNFGRAMHTENTTVRTVFAAKWSEGSMQEIEFEVIADAFLYHMVRRMAYLQMLVGRARLSVEAFVEVVGCKRAPSPGMAPAAGLELRNCFYDPAWQDQYKQGMI